MDWNWNDILIHALLIPVYQIVSTFRHELFHAIMVWRDGLKITAFKVFPHKYNGRFYWGRVSWTGTPSSGQAAKHIFLMPYYVNLLCLTVGVPLVLMYGWSQFHYLAVTTIMLIVSPVVDTTYNVLKWKLTNSGDWAIAMKL